MPQNYLENFKKIQLIFKKSNLNFKTKKILINGTRCEDSLNMWIAKNVHENKTELQIYQQGEVMEVIDIMYLKTMILKYQISFILMDGQKKM